jgi:predicted ATPase with chaperone activity
MAAKFDFAEWGDSPGFTGESTDVSPQIFSSPSLHPIFPQPPIHQAPGDRKLGQRNRHSFSREVRQRLLDWIDIHKTAYPRTQEYERLASETGLSSRQVKNWFVNHRGRQLKKAAADGDLAAGVVRKRIRWVRPEKTETTMPSETEPLLFQ